MTRPDLGDHAAGPVIDSAAWTSESRIRRTRPPRRAAGIVHGIYPSAPRVVAVLTAAGKLEHILVGMARR